jgi:hypothetical protein
MEGCRFDLRGGTPLAASTQVDVRDPLQNLQFRKCRVGGAFEPNTCYL